jgi:putative hydrolase of the HAD superfamily
LGELFHGIEIVSDKNPEAYKRIFNRYGDGPERAVMVGNSLKSDIVPAIAAGSWGVFIPHELTWTLEHVAPPTYHPRFKLLNGFNELHEFITKIS